MGCVGHCQKFLRRFKTSIPPATTRKSTILFRQRFIYIFTEASYLEHARIYIPF
ncbi:hypothetical protein K443DRAFT_354643 [Laccaria amethystina LaAM-08-1]|uniref:Unplaced genomic scaffold K443scaffold_251, whole genome shotgun sequence n=1 Tax=Laccaria amethystina LaAM-08-1 TaxID=1095629 RepID=A0A0C9XEL9_9AGAR|nr:hypothetical protein K443DRAFT_354643 [Laccaria amethystina LaAM-08-1]